MPEPKTESKDQPGISSSSSTNKDGELELLSIVGPQRVECRLLTGKRGSIFSKPKIKDDMYVISLFVKHLFADPFRMDDKLRWGGFLLGKLRVRRPWTNRKVE